MTSPSRAAPARAIALLRLTASLPASAALLHGAGAVLCGLILIVEPPDGYAIRVYDGPRTVMPLQAWGALFLTAGITILALRGSVPSRWALAVLAGVWGVFGGGAVAVGLLSDQAATLGGTVFLLMAAGSMRAAWEFDRWPRCTHQTSGRDPAGR